MRNNPFRKPFCKLFSTAMLALAGCVLSASAQLALPLYESFPLSYTNNESGAATETTYFPQGGPNYPAVRIGTGNSINNWSVGGGNGNGSPLIVGPAGLSYTGLGDPAAPASAGLYFRTNNTTGGRSRGMVFQSQTAGSVYASFLLNLETAPTLDRRLIVILTDGVTAQPTGGPLGVWIETDGRISISKSVNSPNTPTVQPAPVATSASPLAAGTHLIVVRYKFDESADDEVALWIDPTGIQLGVAEGSVPAPTLSGTTGTDTTAIAAFYEFHPSTEIPASFILDEVRVGLNWASVTPAGAVCNSAFISTEPTDTTVFEGLAARFSMVAGGTTPTYQWQVSTDGGNVWNNVAGGIGANGPTYSTPPTALSNNGDKYRGIATVACNNSSATSAVATVTITPAVATPSGVILDDVFADFQYNNPPVDSSNSVWLQSATGTLDAGSGTHLLATSPAGSVTWLAYLTDDSVTNQPIHLAVGKTLKVTVDFKGNNIVASAGNFRIGLFDLADGGVRPMVDGAGVAGSGLNVRGYMTAINYGQNFSANPFSLYVRNNLVADLMGTTGNYVGLGGGPSDYAGAPAFQNGVTYRAEFSVARTAVSTVTFTTTITGGGTNWTHSRVDDDYAYPRFDTLGIRSAGAALAADSFEFSRVLVEVVDGAPAPIPLTITKTGNDVTLTWANPAFTLQAAPNVTGTYTNVAGATSPYIVPANGASRFFRLIWP
jgi:hypothetical protein